MIRKLLLIGFTISRMAALCQETPAPESSGATVFVYRHKAVMASRVLPWIFVTGQHPSPGEIEFPGTSFGLVAKMVNGRHFKISVPPGRVTFRAWFRDQGKQVTAHGQPRVVPLWYLLRSLRVYDAEGHAVQIETEPGEEWLTPTDFRELIQRIGKSTRRIWLWQYMEMDFDVFVQDVEINAGAGQTYYIRLQYTGDGPGRQKFTLVGLNPTFMSPGATR